MSQNGLKDFIARLQDDPSLRNALKQRSGTDADHAPATDVIAFAAEQGYDFTVADISEDLSDQALESVSGGTRSGPRLTSWSISGDADDRPTEEVAFYYNKIAFDYSAKKS